MSEESPFERQLLAKLEELVQVQRALLDFKQREATGAIKPYFMVAKPGRVWKQCRAEVLSLLDIKLPFLDWRHAQMNKTFRDPELGNIYRLTAWRRFLGQHAVPCKPEDESGVVLVGIGKETKDGPPAVYRLDSQHCAESAFRDTGGSFNEDSWGRYKSEPNKCRYCKKRGSL